MFSFSLPFYVTLTDTFVALTVFNRRDQSSSSRRGALSPYCFPPSLFPVEKEVFSHRAPRNFSYGRVELVTPWLLSWTFPFFGPPFRLPTGHIALIFSSAGVFGFRYHLDIPHFRGETPKCFGRFFFLSLFLFVTLSGAACRTMS